MSVAACAELVERGDPDRFRAVMAAPVEARAQLFPLYAFNLEVARADADRQHRYIALVATPSLPDQSTYPHRWRSVMTAFCLSFLLLGVGTLVSAAVREHAKL